MVLFAIHSKRGAIIATLASWSVHFASLQVIRRNQLTNGALKHLDRRTYQHQTTPIASVVAGLPRSPDTRSLRWAR
jgi:hypothetical protein